jgi:hypothetical protein
LARPARAVATACSHRSGSAGVVTRDETDRGGIGEPGEHDTAKLVAFAPGRQHANEVANRAVDALDDGNTFHQPFPGVQQAANDEGVDQHTGGNQQRDRGHNAHAGAIVLLRHDQYDCAVQQCLD